LDGAAGVCRDREDPEVRYQREQDELSTKEEDEGPIGRLRRPQTRPSLNADRRGEPGLLTGAPAGGPLQSDGFGVHQPGDTVRHCRVRVNPQRRSGV